jgi:protein-arginine kinase activator protein McsA
MAKERVKRYKGRNCDSCGKSFDGKTSWQKFCSTDCHDNFWKTKNPMAKIAKIEAQLSDHARRLEKLESGETLKNLIDKNILGIRDLIKSDTVKP